MYTYVCVFVCQYVCMCACAHVHMHAYMYIGTYGWMYVHMYVGIHTRMYVCVRKHVVNHGDASDSRSFPLSLSLLRALCRTRSLSLSLSLCTHISPPKEICRYSHVFQRPTGIRQEHTNAHNVCLRQMIGVFMSCVAYTSLLLLWSVDMLMCFSAPQESGKSTPKRTTCACASSANCRAFSSLQTIRRAGAYICRSHCNTPQHTATYCSTLQHMCECRCICHGERHRDMCKCVQRET